jgi:uncharacterized membrane protein YgdD (TMEM256/DUF423 family)
MTSSKQLAGLLGPILLAIGITEAMNLKAIAVQTAPVVYLNGTILFAGGLAILRAHNRWIWGWPVLVTMSGWVTMVLGMWRMVAPTARVAGESIATYGILTAVVGIGAVLTVLAYGGNGTLEE